MGAYHFEYLTDKLPVTALILPIVFDDLRETGIGSQFSTAFENPTVTHRLARTLIGKSLVENFSAPDSTGHDMLALQEAVEHQSASSYIFNSSDGGFISYYGSVIVCRYTHVYISPLFFIINFFIQTFPQTLRETTPIFYYQQHLNIQLRPRVLKYVGSSTARIDE